MEKISKKHITVSFIGHLGSGKSTILGNLIYLLGGIDRRTLEKFENETQQMGKSGFKFAWILNKTKEERYRNVTIDWHIWKITTPKYDITTIDNPGSGDYVKNMYTGTCLADAAILVIGASSEEFEAAMSTYGQAKQHALLAFTCGIKQLIVLVNKMEHEGVKFSMKRFEEIKTKTNEYLKKVGYDITSILYIPVSGWLGLNLTTLALEMEWYKGPTLLQALDMLEPLETPKDKPFRMTLSEVFKIAGIGTVVVGRVIAGSVKVGDKVAFATGPSMIAPVKSIEAHYEARDKAVAGDIIGLNIMGVSIREIDRGVVLGNSEIDPPHRAASFIAKIVLMPDCKVTIKQGYEPVVDCHTAHIACKFAELISLVDKRTGKETEAKPACIKAGQSAIVKLIPTKPMCVEPFSEYPALGRFAIRDMKMTIAVGIIKSVEKIPLVPKKQ